MKNRASICFSPFVFFVPSMRTRCIWTTCALSPVAVFLLLEKSFGALAMIFALSLAGFFAGISANAVRGERLFRDVWLSILEGFLCGFCIPASFNIPLAFFVLFFSILAFARVFGGFQNAAAKPAAVAVVVCFLLSPQCFQAAFFNLQGAALKAELQVLPFEPFVRAAFSKWCEIPAGYLSLLADNGSEILAIRFPLFFMLSAVVLASFGMTDFVAACAFLIFFGIFESLPHSSAFQGDFLMSLCSCGAFFYAFFLLQSFGSLPQFCSSRILFGFVATCLALFAEKSGAAPIGIPLAVLCANLIFPLLFVIEERVKVFVCNINLKGGHNER